jgi:hypothetical protein
MDNILEFIRKRGFESKVAIVGSRDYQYVYLVERFIWALPYSTQLVSGGSGNVDIQVNNTEDARRRMGSPDPIIHYPQYGIYGSKLAPIVRNGLIIAERPCCVVVFMSDPFTLSDGSADVYKKAKRAGITRFCFHR